MKVVVPTLASAVLGGVLAVGLIVGGTALGVENTRPDVAPTADAADSVLGNVEYGSR